MTDMLLSKAPRSAVSISGKVRQGRHNLFQLTRIVYDREERSQLAVEQGKFAEENFIKPYREILEQWSAQYAA